MHPESLNDLSNLEAKEFLLIKWQYCKETRLIGFKLAISVSSLHLVSNGKCRVSISNFKHLNCKRPGFVVPLCCVVLFMV